MSDFEVMNTPKLRERGFSGRSRGVLLFIWDFPDFRGLVAKPDHPPLRCAWLDDAFRVVLEEDLEPGRVSMPPVPCRFALEWVR